MEKSVELLTPYVKNIFFIGLIWKIESVWIQSIWDDVIRMGVIWYYYCPGKRGKFEPQPRYAIDMVRWTDNTCKDGDWSHVSTNERGKDGGL